VDLTSQEAVAQVFEDVRREHPGGIRCLVNNAGTWAGMTSAWEPLAGSIRQSLELNFFSAVHCIDRLLAEKPANNLSIINIGATASRRGGAKMAPFAVAKSALRILSESLARELGADGVHVAHLVLDGVLDNPRTRELNPDYDPDKFMALESVAEEVLRVALQDQSAWTFEWELRPFGERW